MGHMNLTLASRPSPINRSIPHFAANLALVQPSQPCSSLHMILLNHSSHARRSRRRAGRERTCSVHAPPDAMGEQFCGERDLT